MTKAMPLLEHFDNRPYQNECIAKVRSDFRAGNRKVIAELPTGTGKTRMFCTLPSEGARVLVIVPFLSLISQTVASIKHLRQVRLTSAGSQRGCTWERLHSSQLGISHSNNRCKVPEQGRPDSC